MTVVFCVFTAETDKGPVVEEEVKSLEEIYRERALMSMMEAKRKKGRVFHFRQLLVQLYYVSFCQVR